MTEPLRNINHHGGWLPAAPLVPFILRDAEHLHRLHDDGAEARGRAGAIRGLERLSNATRINVRALGRWTSGRSAWITLDNADKYLCATDRHLRDVWPWIYTPEQIAADIAAVENENPGQKRARLRANALLRDSRGRKRRAVTA